MILYLSPQRSDENLKIIKKQDCLIINNMEYDFSNLSEGSVLPKEAVDCKWISSDITKINNEIILTIIFPIGPNASEQQRFANFISVYEDGEVVLPE